MKRFFALWIQLHSWRGVILALVLAVASIVLAGRYHIHHAREDTLANLRVLAQLKAGEIERWLEEKRANIIQPDSGFLASAYVRWSGSSPGAERDSIFRKSLAFYLERYPEASRVMILNLSGHFLISTDQAQTHQPVPPDFGSDMPVAPAQLVNFHADEAGNPRLGFLAPLSNAGLRLGFVLIELDPQRYFYPSLKNWPRISESGEILLYRRIGKQIEYLSPLQHEALRPLSRQTASASEPQLSTQQRAAGYEGPGFDGQGRPVLRAIYPIKGTDWFVAARLSMAEADARAWHDNVVFALLLLPLLAGVAYIQHLSRVRVAEVASAATRRRDMRLLLDFINAVPESLFMLDRNGIILVMNATGATRYGLTPKQLIGTCLWNYLPPDLCETRKRETETVFREQQPLTLHDCRDGKDFCTYIYPGENGGACVFVSMDITERNRVEAELRERDELLHRLSEHLPDSYLYRVYVYADGRREFVFVSSGVERIHGVSPDKIRTDSRVLYALVDLQQLSELAEKEAECLQTMSDFSMTVRMRRADGSWGWFAVHSHPHAGENGGVIWDGVATDVTGLRENELMLAMQARRTAALLSLPVRAEVLDEADFLKVALDVAAELTGSQIAFVHFVHEELNQIELLGCSTNTQAHYCHAVFDRHYPIEQAGLWADVIRNHQPLLINDYAYAAGKHALPVGAELRRLISVPVIEDGVVRLVAWIGNKAEDYTERDVETLQLIANEAWRITHRRRVERDLFQIAQVVEASPAVCFRWDVSEGWPVQFVSDNIRRWGYQPEQLISGEVVFASLIHPDDRERIMLEVETYLGQGLNYYEQEYRLRCADGRYIWVLDLTTVLRYENGQLRAIEGVLSDISERKSQQLELEESLQDQLALNRRLEEAQTQLLQSEKLAAIGQLAAGVAHELNNPIGFVYSNLTTLTEYVTGLIALCDAYTHLIEEPHLNFPELIEIRHIKQDQDYDYLRSDIFPLLDESREGLMRVRKIVQDLRDFSRTGNQEWAAADLHKGIDSTLNIVANELKYKCTVVKEYGELPEVICVISQLNQVFLNLFVNSAQAIEKQGMITVRTGMTDAEHIWISVSDTGSGIPPESLSRIFEPFYTTKPIGVGTGLGLALVFGIISRHHGKIEVSSEVGKGTTFVIHLPVRQEFSKTGV